MGSQGQAAARSYLIHMSRSSSATSFSSETSRLRSDTPRISEGHVQMLAEGSVPIRGTTRHGRISEPSGR